MPDYTELVFVTSKENAEKNADKLTRFLRATKKGYEHVKANPEKGVEEPAQESEHRKLPAQQGC
ncbi:MAG: ABC transporter substrate-binding protein [[Eubacterium] siraeum]